MQAGTSFFIYRNMSKDQSFEKLEDLISKIPGVNKPIISGTYANGIWWVKFSIDINHPLAWNIVQEFGHAINYLSINERLSTVFYPVSTPPTAKDDPTAALAWIIEATEKELTPYELTEWLVARLPYPVEDVNEWMRVAG